jgi:hypothetical protein
MDDARLEANPEETEAAMERQNLFKEEINFDIIGSSEDRCADRLLAVTTSPRCKEAVPRQCWVQARRFLLHASESCAAPSLQYEREIFARVQARTVLQGGLLKEGG